jgi:hypothetical protein
MKYWSEKNTVNGLSSKELAAKIRMVATSPGVYVVAVEKY